MIKLTLNNYPTHFNHTFWTSLFRLINRISLFFLLTLLASSRYGMPLLLKIFASYHEEVGAHTTQLVLMFCRVQWVHGHWGRTRRFMWAVGLEILSLNVVFEFKRTNSAIQWTCDFTDNFRRSSYKWKGHLKQFPIFKIKYCMRIRSTENYLLFIFLYVCSQYNVYGCVWEYVNDT